MRSKLAAAEASMAANEQHPHAHEAAQAELQHKDARIAALEAENRRLRAATESSAEAAALRAKTPQQVRTVHCIAGSHLLAEGLPAGRVQIRLATSLDS